MIPRSWLKESDRSVAVKPESHCPAKESVPHLDHSDLVKIAADPVVNTGFRRPQRTVKLPRTCLTM